MSTTLQKRVALIAVAAVTLLAGVAVPAQAIDTGTISGHLTDNGAPVANAWVSVSPQAGGGGGSAVTNGAGEYAIPGLAVGQYRVSFRPSDGPPQYAYGKPDYSNANLIQVNAGAVTTVDEQLLPTGMIEGTFVDRQGQGLDNVHVVMSPLYGSGGSYTTTSTSAGRFSARVFAGRYKVEFHVRPPQPAGVFIQYAGGTDLGAEATVFDVAANATITVNETMLPTGRMSGRFTDAAGNGMPNVEVSISRADLGRGPSAYTDANGYYSFPHMRAGSAWRVLFNAYQQGFQQYAFGKLRESEASLITITEGQTTEVSDSRLPTGSVKVIAKDSVSGAGVEQFQAGLDRAGYGDATNGEVLITNVPIGTHPLTIGAYGYHDLVEGTAVTVTAGDLTEVTVCLRPKSRIETRVVDAATGEPVVGVCLITAKPQRFLLPTDGCYEQGQISSASGRVLVETGGAGWFHVFAYPVEPAGYGAQWVGVNGGTGTQLSAQLIKVEADKASAAPVIKLDRAGTVTGKVTSPAGAALAGAGVAIGDWSPFTGGPGFGSVTTDEEGRYTIDVLGPYQWPLLFGAEQQGAQWSGQVGNRHLAQTVTLRAGETTGYDFSFKEAVTVKTTITGVTGDCYLFAFNAVSGDNMGFQWVEDCTRPVDLPMVGPQVVKVRVDYFDGENWRERWWGGGSFLTAKPVLLPSSGSKNVVIAF